jgi:hypothetical protein
MNLLKYGDYISEKAIYDLLLESKLVYSKKFIGFLSKMKTNPIAKKLIDLYSIDINLQHNYVDVGSEKDTVSFTPDRKVQELEKSQIDTYEVIDDGRYLTNADGNNIIYNSLGYQKRENVWAPQEGTIGIIIKEVVSPRSGNIYVWFKGIDEWEGKETVLNKEAIEKSDSSSTYKIWSTSRNNIKIGRLVRAILTSAKVSFTDRDIEEFVNSYKATYDIMANALIRFDIVEGDQIGYWYNYRRYAIREGILGNSCMADVPVSYFDIYVNNPKACKLIILFDENGSIEDSKYKSDKIIGRCLLWTTEKGQLMDRIYTIKDSDVELFKEFGKKNGFWWKSCQDSDNDFRMENGDTAISSPSLTIKLDNSDYDEYPYMDTFYMLDIGNDILTNDSNIDYDRILRSTDGEFDD